MGPLVSEVVTHVQVSEGEADVTTDLCGEVGIKSEAFQVNTSGSLITLIYFLLFWKLCVRVCVHLLSVQITEFGSGQVSTP